MLSVEMSPASGKPVIILGFELKDVSFKSREFGFCLGSGVWDSGESESDQNSELSEESSPLSPQ
jgi:hypothetical protein